MDINKPRRPKSLLEIFAGRPIKDNKYIILQSEKAQDGTERPTVLKEFKVNRKLMRADVKHL